LRADGRKVLVTRRRDDAFIFPSVWVLPGGHPEKGESLLETGKREVEEETGVKLADEDMRLCGLWESCYPVQLDHGPLKKHHLVVFYRAIVHKPTTEITLRLQEEVSRGSSVLFALFALFALLDSPHIVRDRVCHA
jgi:8-oxo-dGTP pyrophosphatase MutT (NUDIX family)